jgi:hypothetical protein
MPKMNLSHFEATFLLALFCSAVLGVVTRGTDRDRLHYGLKSMAWFVVTVFGLGWLMWLGHR